MTTKSDQIQAVSRKFQRLFVRYCLFFLTIVTLSLWVWDPTAGQGALLGGIAGLLGFWMMARAVEKLALQRPEKLQLTILRWSVVRIALYAVAFVRAYTLDREDFHGLYGAVAGFLVIRFVLMYLGLTGRVGLGAQVATTEPTTPDR